MTKKTIIVIMLLVVVWILLPIKHASASVLETVEVPSYSYTTYSSDTVLEEGKTYLLEVSGSFTFSSGDRYADAEFSYNPDANLWTETLVGGGYPEHLLDLLINGQPQDWLGSQDGVTYTAHTYSPDHKYKLYFVGEGEPLIFNIYDLSPDWNEGSLFVTISEFTPSKKEDCMKGGWMNYDGMFRNQGMCMRSL